ncbi:TAXI family TRAP transporter solute-binding subunit [Vibrio sp. SCSIO 43136]|uniref:TAXI family TRAP transporter solute-binding subunit n=1 Tax=Vibrio sp. SCSIO 43136 TaxID=2819101 RepID=UPI002075F22B|nr:TAXI family TRAP transporter solute-binding subunit [Vibrio sp. SCSIO 43136]USD66177.1 TAXI family TRAP transporter solute-binding subunit [Vibrio sp. SCSIO 43136]
MSRAMGFGWALLALLAMPIYAANHASIGTGAENGVYYPVGQALCRTVVKQKSWRDSQCQVQLSDGSVSNLNALREGKLDFAIVQADWQFFAYSPAYQFGDNSPLSGLRAVFSLHAEPFTVVARKDSQITHFDQLVGKRVNIGNPGSGQRATMEVLMKAMGWQSSDFEKVTEFSAIEQTQALCSNQVDAVVYTVGHPSRAIQDMTLDCETTIVEVSGRVIDSLIDDHTFYSKAEIPGGIYRGTPNDVATFAVRATLVTLDTVDPKLVYGLVKAVFSDLDTFRRLLPVLAPLSEMSMTRQGIFVPFHQGAQQYFEQVKLIN